MCYLPYLSYYYKRRGVSIVLPHRATCRSLRSVSATASYFTVLIQAMTCFLCKSRYIICIWL